MKKFPCFAVGLSFILILAAMAAAQSGRAKPSPSPPPTPEDDTINVVTEEVKVNVAAFDEEGNFLNDVKIDDLVIDENNILHQAQTLRRIPANVLIVMDTGGEMRQRKSLDQTRRVARSMVAALAPADSAAVMQYSDKPEIVAEWTTDKDLLAQAISKRTKFGRSSAFAAALQMAADFLSRQGLENKHLVLITDGTDTIEGQSAKVIAMRRLLGSDINVHVISYTQLEADDITPRTKMISNSPPPKAMPDEIAAQLPNARDRPASTRVGPTINLDRTMLKKLRARKADLEQSEHDLIELAENANGVMIIARSLDEMIDKTAVIARMIDSSYVLTYIPKIPLGEKGQPAERIIEVTSRRPGLIVTAKRKLIVEDTRRQ